MLVQEQRPSALQTCGTTNKKNERVLTSYFSGIIEGGLDGGGNLNYHKLHEKIIMGVSESC